MTDNVVNISDLKGKIPPAEPVYQIKGIGYDLMAQTANVSVLCEEENKFSYMNVAFPIELNVGDATAKEQIKMKLLDFLIGLEKYLVEDLDTSS